MAVATRETTVEIKRHRFTADEYQRMAEAGVLDPDARIELIQGEIVEMFAIGASHVGCVGLTNWVLTGQLERRAMVLVQCAIRIASDGVPQPDFVVVRGDYDRTKLPTPTDTFLVIEVSDSSLAIDRRVKLPLYGGANIREAWIFDIPHTRIERHTEPHAGGYRTTAVAGPGERLASTTLPDLSIAADEVFGLPLTGSSRSGQ